VTSVPLDRAARRVSDVLRDEHDPTLADCLQGWLHHSTPWIIATATGAALGARLALGKWVRTDVAPVVAIAALQPFTEWAIHTYVLHSRAVRVGPIVIDLHAAREHRRHHRDPKAFEPIFIPLADLVLALGAGIVVLPLVLPLRTALTTFTAAAAMAGVYEWTHFLIHTPYRPRHRRYRRIARGHRLHHYRNERYWMGVTSGLADRLLGTAPPRSHVAVSDTVRTVV